jgi:hypothetical protein
MHRVQRALVGYLIADPQEPRPTETLLMPVQGTPFYVPILEAPVAPAARMAIGFAPDMTSGLVAADLEDDQVLDLLAREGLGAVAEVTWDSGWYVGHVRVHDHDLDTALAKLAEALGNRMPGRYVPTATARAKLDRLSISAPSDAGHARGMADWAGDGGDLQGSLLADRGDDWPTGLIRALGHAANARHGVKGLKEVRTAVAAGEQPSAFLEAGPLRLALSLSDYTPDATA